MHISLYSLLGSLICIMLAVMAHVFNQNAILSKELDSYKEIVCPESLCAGSAVLNDALHVEQQVIRIRFPVHGQGDCTAGESQPVCVELMARDGASYRDFVATLWHMRELGMQTYRIGSEPQ